MLSYSEKMAFYSVANPPKNIRAMYIVNTITSAAIYMHKYNHK